MFDMVLDEAMGAGHAHPAQRITIAFKQGCDGRDDSARLACGICGGSGDTPMVYNGYVVPCYVCSGTGRLSDAVA